MLGRLIDQHGSDVWLVNTGWSGGPYGVGSRMKLPHTRATVHAVLSGELRGVPSVTDPIFGLAMPTKCGGVPDEVLNPRNTWKDAAKYDEQAKKLAKMFRDNFTKFGSVDPAIAAAGPK
jgi:phosphoenolpyruvate carboxykinase (ATP)